MKLTIRTIARVLLLTLLAPGLLFAWSAADRDFDGDGTIGFGDFLMFAKAYGTQQSDYGLSGDGDVDFGDFLMFVQNYGRTVAETEIQDTITVSLPSLTKVDQTMQFVYIPPGRFTMGRPYESSWLTGPTQRMSEPWPNHDVTISKGFYLGKYEVTQRQWEAVMGTTPWHGQVSATTEDYLYPTIPAKEDPDCPASYVSWMDAQAFITMLNQRAGRLDLYRLPTEAEWEYSCRAETTTEYSWGDDRDRQTLYAWCFYNTVRVERGYAHEVGTKKPNPWGLYDMHGNVSEWCHDEDWTYTEGAQVDPLGSTGSGVRIVRGGHFHDEDQYIGSWVRYKNTQDYRSPLIGFRLVMAAE